MSDALPVGRRLAHIDAAGGYCTHRSPTAYSLYLEDPEGNVVELWDFFERGIGLQSSVTALADDGA
jgi:hypothetical protein